MSTSLHISKISPHLISIFDCGFSSYSSIVYNVLLYMDTVHIQFIYVIQYIYIYNVYILVFVVVIYVMFSSHIHKYAYIYYIHIHIYIYIYTQLIVDLVKFPLHAALPSVQT